MNTYQSIKIPGRGAGINPAGRFETITYHPDADDITQHDGDDRRELKTQYFKDTSQSLITYNDSPDVGFSASINPYRGCEHGCVYCYARPTHEFLGLSSGVDFEAKILVKENAPELLRRELASSKWQPQALAMSGVTDCYQPIEKQMQITRRCLQVLAAFRNPVGIVTKSHLLIRDIDVLQELASFHGVLTIISITTLDADLARRMEPRAAQPERRLGAIEKLAQAGIPVGVMVAPVIPGLNDDEIPAIIAAAGQAGAGYAGYVMLRLPFAVKDLFLDWLERHYPDRRSKVVAFIQEVRGGKLNNAEFHTRMRGEGARAELIKNLFQISCRKARFPEHWPKLSTASFTNPDEKQPLLL